MGSIAIAGGSSGRDVLKANRSYYVATTGSDSNPGTLALPWATPQHAFDFIIENLDLAGFTITVNIGDGTYSGTNILFAESPWVGGGAINFIGNQVTPNNVLFSTTSDCVLLNAFLVGLLQFDGMQLTSSGGAGFNLAQQAFVNIGITAGVNFGSCSSAHILNQGGGGSVILVSAAYTISGGAATHIESSFGSFIYHSTGVTLTGTPAFNFFAQANTSGTIWFDGSTFTGAATGPRFSVQTHGELITDNHAATYLPGNAAGTVDPNAGYDGYDGAVQASGAPTTTNFPIPGTGGLYIDTLNSNAYICVNLGGVLKKVQLV